MSAGMTSAGWSRGTTRTASRSAGSRRGRTRASTRPIRIRRVRRTSTRTRRRTSRASCTSATRCSSRSATRSSASSGCRGSTCSSSRATTTPGISTQNVVEKALLAEGTSRQELGRERFEERVWEWLHEYGGKILVQFRRMGASLDYRRTRFTMDDDYVRAVMRFFVHLYRRGLDLPGEPDHQLVPVPRDVAVRSRARPRRRRRHALDDPLPARRRRRLHRDRDGAAGDDPGRRRRRRASRRRPLSST